ncbi:MAG: NADH dehydrogenase subunit D [Desulfurococcales archaeon ex4484_217_2]|nr:MAG: NADH dehydrogenase subunit D [Desulfurococcales archaeon ex4484_217_2]
MSIQEMRRISGEGGRETFELIIGPVHMETENFSIIVTVEGDTVVEAKVNAGFLHRAFEKLAENRTYIQNVPLLLRVCVPDPDHAETAYSMAVEQLLDIEIPDRAKYIRTIVLEMARISAHLFWTFGMSAAVGLYTVGQWSVADRERFIELFEELTGARIYHIYNFPGGVRYDLPMGWTDKLMKVVNYMEKRLKEYDKVFFENDILITRSRGLAKISTEEAISLGVTGPNLRATGVPYDFRKLDPYAAYPYIDFEIPTGKYGDAYDRIMVRRREIEISLNIIKQAIKELPSGPIMAPIPHPLYYNVPPGDAYARVESSKGEFGFYVVSDGSDRPWRVHIRGPSFIHGVQLLEKLLKNVRIADIPVVLKSLDNCPPDIDR